MLNWQSGDICDIYMEIGNAHRVRICMGGAHLGKKEIQFYTWRFVIWLLISPAVTFDTGGELNCDGSYFYMRQVFPGAAKFNTILIID